MALAVMANARRQAWPGSSRLFSERLFGCLSGLQAIGPGGEPLVKTMQHVGEGYYGHDLGE